MIHLSVEPYCNNCPMFEATSVQDANIYYVSGVPIDVEQKDDKVVFCKNRRNCRAIHDYLKQEALENGS